MAKHENQTRRQWAQQVAEALKRFSEPPYTDFISMLDTFFEDVRYEEFFLDEARKWVTPALVTLLEEVGEKVDDFGYDKRSPELIVKDPQWQKVMALMAKASEALTKQLSKFPEETYL